MYTIKLDNAREADEFRLWQAQKLMREAGYVPRNPARPDLEWLKQDVADCLKEDRVDGARRLDGWVSTRQKGQSRQLMRLAVLTFDGLGDDTADGAALVLARVLLDDDSPTFEETRACMEHLFDLRTPSVEHIQGFVEAAREIYVKL